MSVIVLSCLIWYVISFYISLPLPSLLQPPLPPSTPFTILVLLLPVTTSFHPSPTGMMHAPYRATSVGGSIFNGLTLNKYVTTIQNTVWYTILSISYSLFLFILIYTTLPSLLFFPFFSSSRLIFFLLPPSLPPFLLPCLLPDIPPSLSPSRTPSHPPSLSPSHPPAPLPSQWASPATCRRDDGQPRRGRYGSGLRRSQINCQVRHAHIYTYRRTRTAQHTRTDRQRNSLKHRHLRTHTHTYTHTHEYIHSHAYTPFVVFLKYWHVLIFFKLPSQVLIFSFLIFFLGMSYLNFLGNLMREEICMLARTSLYVLCSLHVIMWFNVM